MAEEEEENQEEGQAELEREEEEDNGEETETETEEEEEEDEEEYAVERVLDVRKAAVGPGREFKLKWVGYPTSQGIPTSTATARRVDRKGSTHAIQRQR